MRENEGCDHNFGIRVLFVSLCKNKNNNIEKCNFLIKSSLFRAFVIWGTGLMPVVKVKQQ